MMNALVAEGFHPLPASKGERNPLLPHLKRGIAALLW